uniref:Uncharacterized protein n=1 Tax=Meloidogyne floridensis TaxID=298350 RepID=A0A915P547_9BILA
MSQNSDDEHKKLLIQQRQLSNQQMELSNQMLQQILSRQMFTPINSLPTPIVPTKVPNVGTSNGNLIKQTKNGWKVSNLNFGINQDDSICLSIKLEKSAKINEQDNQFKELVDNFEKLKESFNSKETQEKIFLECQKIETNFMEKILKHVNEQLNIPKIVKDGEQNVLKIKQLETKIGELTCSNAAVSAANCCTYQKDVGFVEFFRLKNPYEHVKLEQYALSKGFCNSIEKGQNQNFPPFMPQPPISQPYGYNNYSTIQQPLNNNFQQNIQSKPNNLTNSSNNQPQEVENYENLNIPKNGWIVDNLSFTIETKSIELVINLEDTKIGKNGNNNSKAALDAIKYIEKLLVDCSSNKEEDNNFNLEKELLEEKIKELNLNDKNISLQILKMHNDHVNEVKELKNEIKQKMEENNFLMKKVEELNKYKIKFLEEKRKQKNENKEELIKEDLIELLENNYLDNSKNKKLRDEKGGICVEIDNNLVEDSERIHQYKKLLSSPLNPEESLEGKNNLMFRECFGLYLEDFREKFNGENEIRKAFDKIWTPIKNKGKTPKEYLEAIKNKGEDTFDFLYNNMIKKLIVSVEKMMENDENFKVLQQFFDETPGAFGRANYIIGCKTRDKPKHNFEADTISRIIPMNIWSEVYRRRIHFYLEEIVEINNKDLENYGNLYLNIINKFRKFINKNYTEEEMEVELTDKNLEELKRELIDKESLNKFLKEEHSKMIKKLIEEDEIFKNNIEELRPHEKKRMNNLIGEEKQNYTNNIEDKKEKILKLYKILEVKLIKNNQNLPKFIEEIIQLNFEIKENIQKIYYLIIKLIIKSKMFRIFLCKKEKEIEIINLKSNLNEIVGLDYLDKLEREFPDLFKIGLMHSSMKTMFYKKYLQYKIGNENSKLIESRIVIPLLIKNLMETKKLINQIKINTDFFLFVLNTEKQEEIHLLEALENKIKWLLLTKIFSKKEEEIISLKNICLIFKFQIYSIITIQKNKINLVKEFVKKLKTIGIKKEFLKNTKNLEEILKWKGLECENEREQEIVFVEQRAFLIKEHKDFVVKENKLLSKICKIPGIKTRLQQLVPQIKMFSDVLKVVNEGDFNRIRSRFTSYIEAKEENQEFKLANKYSLNFLVWVFWVDKKFEEKTEEIEYLNKIWLFRRNYYFSKYDELFELKNKNELEKEGNLMNKIQFGIWKNLKEENKNKLIKNWKDIENGKSLGNKQEMEEFEGFLNEEMEKVLEKEINWEEENLENNEKEERKELYKIVIK